MEAGMDAKTPLDYVEFFIVPSQNRYETCVRHENKEEKVACGLLEHLLLHSVDIKELNSKGSNAKYKLYRPENPHNIKWFTKSTLLRFLHIIGSATILDITKSLKNEISQLEEARRFHLSLYEKGREYQPQTRESDDRCANGTGSTTKGEDSAASKNELLQAMDLRLDALREELTAAFDQAAGSRYSVEDMTDLENFCRHFGSEDLSDSLRKHIELRHRAQAIENSSSRHLSESEGVKSKEGNNQTSKSTFSGTPVKYGVSPAKAAQVERQSSTESDGSSLSSEEEQPSVERSRPLVRSASPRRSASPLRRIQIGRSGSRRSTAITIKSLNYFPARDRTFLSKDANGSDEEESEHASKKSETDVRRMSVQDAIHLFESKQSDQSLDLQKTRSLLSASIGANKSVLRRWSSGMGGDSSRSPEDTSTEDTKVQNNVKINEVTYHSPESEVMTCVAQEDYLTEPHGLDLKSDSPEKVACSTIVMQEGTHPTESTDAGERLITSSEWSRQKETELNELLMKMMESKPVKSRTVAPASGKRQSLPSETRGGFYDHYKEKRDEKLRGEASKKRTEKDKQFRAMQQVLDAKKSQLASANASGAGKKHTVKKIQKPLHSASQLANPKVESPKPGGVKKASSKASSLPSMRKSWPSLPSPGTRGPSPAKTPALSTGVTPTRRKSQTTPPVSQLTPEVETSHLKTKSIKSNQNDSKKVLKQATEKKQESTTNPRKTTKSKVQTAPEDLVSSTKPSKLAKKSSVVPVESKSFLRKGSKTTSSVNSATKKKTSPQEPLRKSQDLTLVDENPTVCNSTDIVVQDEEGGIGELKIQTGTDSRTNARSPRQCEETENGIGEVNPTTNNGAYRGEAPEQEAEAEEESTISPTAWVEIEEHEDHSTTSGDPSCLMVGSPAYKAPVGSSSPRVRHSLSQMLLEESSEPDVIDWGNAENPPAMVSHKDAPKGFKRLLKFARKSKTDANSTGWSSPSIFSEGEDDAEDLKSLNKRSSENLLRMATLQSINNGHQKSSTEYEHPAQVNIRKFDAQSLSQQLQEGNISASATTTKATRSFFSLSAFKGGR